MAKSGDAHDATEGIGRRRRLRGAGGGVAAAAGAGVVGAMASKASAAPGDTMVVGGSNLSGEETTFLAGGTVEGPTLYLRNDAGATITLRPAGNPSDPVAPSTDAPVGSLFTDWWGDFYGIGFQEDGSRHVTALYSSTWATMVVPITPIRYMDTRVPSLRQYIVPGSANFDSAGRVIPKNSTTVPDLVLDLSPIITGGRAAVQANFTALQPVAQGYASLWNEGPWPGTSSINYVPSVPEIANFTQTLIAQDGKIRLKTQRACQFIIDIVGFVLADPFAQINFNFFGGAAAAAAGSSRPVWERQGPPQR